ncbi:glycosyltransferase [Sphingobium sp. SCG-1]|uniref:glycosyltransferase n=1 Tax=Sphingobium sp. SCG-1 TaxID=2072936 RepID=UPI000CD685D1|nr:glycosyltransferase [Sphingobium sp. SCG-1]AUW59741.1 glycosyltransferase [Sphingobium sp. SCG-1]
MLQDNTRPQDTACSDAPDAFRPNIVSCIKSFGPGGVERVALRLTAGWERADVPVQLLVASPDGPVAPQPGSACHRILPPCFMIGRRWPLLRLTASVLAECRNERRGTILFCPGNSYTVVAVMVKIALGRRCPPIVAKISNDLRRDDMPRFWRRLYRQWLRIQGRAINHFAVLSTPMADEVAELMGVPRERIHVVPNPVLSDADLDTYEAPRVLRAGRKFVAVGRLEPQKNYRLMLEAFARGSEDADRLTIYGDGRERLALERIVGALDLAQKVNLAGFSSDMRAELRRYNILLLTSRFEGQPGAVVEALCMGLGIIATRCCSGMPELLDDGALGTLIDRDDLDGLADAIASAKPGKQDIGRARSKARNFTIEAAVPAYAHLFAKVLAANPYASRATAHSSFPRSWKRVKQI